MNLLEIDGDLNLTIAPEVLKIKEFKKIWHRRTGLPKDEKRDRAEKELSYIVLFEHPFSGYATYNEEDRHERLKESLDLPKDWEEDRALKEARKVYAEDFIDTPSSSLLKATYKTLNEFTKYANSIDFSVKQTKLSKYKMQDVAKELKEADNLFDLATKWKQKVEQELTQSGDKVKTRGDIGVSRYADPEKLKRIKEEVRDNS